MIDLKNSIYTSVIRRKDDILFRGRTKDGQRIQFSEAYNPTLFTKSKKQTEYKTIHGECVEPFTPGSMSETNDFVRSYQGVSGGFTLYGNTNFEYQFISDNYPEKHISWNQDQLCIVFLDIETECENGFPDPDVADQRINVITLKTKGKRYVFGIGQFSIADSQNFCCDSEEELLSEFLQVWKKIDPDVLVGWNIRYFDIPYIVRRLAKVLSKERELSPWKWIREEVVNFQGEDRNCFEIMGIATLDYLELYKKFTFVTRENYKLGHIAQVELGRTKLDYSEYDSIQDFYKKDFPKFVAYNVEDVEIVQDIDKKRNLLEMSLSITYMAKINFEDVYSQIRTWDTIIYNHLRAKNIVIPLKEEHTSDHQYEGAYVKDPIIGMHNWIVSYDLTSLYPMLIRLCNIGPDTIVEDKDLPFDRSHLDDITIDDLLTKKLDTRFLKKFDFAMSANKQFFKRNKQSFLSELVEEYFTARSDAKKKELHYKKLLEDSSLSDEIRADYQKQVVLYNTRQQALKVNLNSLYGAIGAVYCRYYDVRQAEAITLTGKLAIRWIENAFNQYFNKALGTKNYDYVVAVDTDSNYLRVDRLVEKLCPNEKDKSRIAEKLDKFCSEVLDALISKKYNELYEYINAHAHTMIMKREVIADRGIWVAKKRYALNVYNSEGVINKTPKLKIQGLEVQRSSTPQICREELKKAISIILTGTEQELQEHVRDFEIKFRNSTVEEISFPRGVNGLDEYSDPKTIFKKATPIHVRGSLVYNHMLKSRKLTKKNSLIREGDKILFVYLKQPNPTKGNIISFVNNLPKELDCHKYVDYDTQFEKAFLDPLDILLQNVQWSAYPKSSLKGLFE